ncbi:MAG: MOSC domain-containing protein, partial [Pseudomonas sp.]
MQLSALYRYPLKSARGQALQSSSLGLLGLDGDRRWMLVERDNGRFLSQRAYPQMSQLTALYGVDGELTLEAPGRPVLKVTVPQADSDLRGVTIWRDTFRVPDAGDGAAQWLSEFIGKEVRLVYVPEERARFLPGGYGRVDDRVAFADGFPLLLIGQGSLDDLVQNVGRPLEMQRFRPNLVVEGAVAFAEDGWKRIRIGEMEFRVLKPCERCILT